MDKVKFNVVFGVWEYVASYKQRRGLIYLSRKWKTVEEVLMLNEVQKYARRLNG